MLLAPTAQALQLVLDTLSNTTRTLSFKINVQKSCHSNRNLVLDVKSDNQILKTVTKCKFLGAVLYGGLSFKNNV